MSLKERNGKCSPKVNFSRGARVWFPSQKNQKEVRNYGVVTPRGASKLNYW